jgi:aminoglycoside phosphotransferase
MIDEEQKIVSSLTGVAPEKIEYSDDGFLNRGYIIDGGRIVFKFKRWPEISYTNEIKVLNFISSLDLDASLQSVGWTSKKDEYLGLYGIVGNTIKPNPSGFGEQIGKFLKKLHAVDFKDAKSSPLEKEFAVWTDRFSRSKDVLFNYFSEEEIARMEEFVNVTAPNELKALGEKPVFSHGDFCLGNIFVDTAGKLGVIDFSEGGYLDEAADFMNIEDDKLISDALDAYDANDTLRKKVSIRRAAHPMFTIGTYRDREEKEREFFVNKIKTWLGDNK